MIGNILRINARFGALPDTYNAYHSPGLSVEKNAWNPEIWLNLLYLWNLCRKMGKKYVRNADIVLSSYTF